MPVECELGERCLLRHRLPSRELLRRSKPKGDFAELAFALKASALGMTVAKPFGDSRPYDFVLESGQTMLRIQVKSAFNPYRGGYQVSSTTREAGSLRIYSKNDIDFIAAYIFPLDVWYIVPVTAIEGNPTHLRLFPQGSRFKHAGKFEECREAWHLITPIRESEQNHAPESDESHPALATSP